MMSVNIANTLTKQGIESHLCATRFEGGLKSKIDNKVNYLYLNRKGTFDIGAVFRLREYIKSNKINVIHAHSSSYFIASIVNFLIPNAKLIWHDHYGNSEHLSKRKKQPLRFFSRSFNTIISVNSLLESWSRDNLKTKKVHYLSNFASLSDISQKTVLKGENGKRIVCLAGLRPQKDHLTLLKAFKIVQDKHQDWTLHLVGNHYDDVCYQDIKAFIQVNNLSNSVFLYHNSTDIKNILSQATIGVLSSISEGLPVSLLEYGLAKLPVVITNVGECGEVLEKGKLGLLVSPSDEKELSQSIDKLIDNTDLRVQYSNLFFKHIFEKYSEEKIIHRLLKIYNS